MNNNIEIDINLYIDIINIIRVEHNKYCENWINEIKHLKTFNLKRKCISDIYSDSTLNEDFKLYMNSFKKNLEEKLFVDILDRFLQKEILEFSFLNYRIKEPDSIIQKLNIKSEVEEGKIPIRKCLNDLLGFRIIDKNYKENMIKVESYLNTKKTDGWKIRFMVRDINGYKAYHIYFMGEKNNHFPIELQIWDIDNKENNIKSHGKHKLGYIKEFIE